MADVSGAAAANRGPHPRVERRPVQAVAPNALNPLLWLIQTLWRYRFLIVLVGALGVAGSVFAALQLPDVYTASGLIEIDPDTESVVGSQQTGRFIPPETLTDTQAAVLRSDPVMLGVIRRLDLLTSEEGASLRPDASELPAGDTMRTALVAVLQRNLTVRGTGRSFVLEVGFESEDPRLAADVVNTAMAEYLGLEVQTERDFRQEAAGLLQGRIDELRVDLDAKEAAVEAFRRESGYDDNPGTEILSDQLTRLNEELVRARSALAEARAVSRQRGTGDLAALPDVVNSGLIQDLRGQEAVQARTVSELAALYRPNHPRLIQARSALAAIRDTIAAETQKIAESIGTTESVQDTRVQALEEEAGVLRTLLNVQRNNELQLARLEREATAAQTLFETFLARFQEVQGTRGFERPDGRIVTPASVPVRPSGPNRYLIVAGGTVVSGALAFMLAVGLGLMDSRTRNAGDVARASGLSPITTMPAVPRGGGPLSRWRNRRFAAAISHLRAALIIGARRQAPLAVAFVDPENGEESARLATAFAQACAVAGDRAVLIDANIVEPRVHTLLGGGNTFGFGELLSENGDAVDALQSDSRTGLTFISAGQGHQSLLRSAWLRQIFEALDTRFDVLVFAVPPLADYPQAQTLVAAVDVSTVVATTGITQRADLVELSGLTVEAADGGRVVTVLVTP